MKLKEEKKNGYSRKRKKSEGKCQKKKECFTDSTEKKVIYIRS